MIPITISEKLFEKGDITPGKKIQVIGQFRSYNTYANNKNRLVLTVFAKSIEVLENQEAEITASKDFISNEVILIGYICKDPIFRQTPFGREITDLLIAVNRAYNKSDYIPCIAWGRNARFCAKMPVGTEVYIIGRIQSRKYEKKYEDGTSEQRVAYEVSISNIEQYNEEELNQLDAAQEEGDYQEEEEAPVEEVNVPVEEPQAEELVVENAAPEVPEEPVKEDITEEETATEEPVAEEDDFIMDEPAEGTEPTLPFDDADDSEDDEEIETNLPLDDGDDLN